MKAQVRLFIGLFLFVRTENDSKRNVRRGIVA